MQVYRNKQDGGKARSTRKEQGKWKGEHNHGRYANSAKYLNRLGNIGCI